MILKTLHRRISFITSVIISKTIVKKNVVVKTRIKRTGSVVITSETKKKEMYLLAYEFKDEKLFGVAHGITGIMYMLLKAYSVSLDL